MIGRGRLYKRVILLLAAVGLFFLLTAVNVTVMQTVYEMAEVRAVQKATEAINNAVRIKMAEHDGHYRDFVDVHKDNEGKIVLMQANTVKLNRVAAETTLAAQSALIRMQEDTLLIPIGQVTGIYFLSNLGPRIRVELVPLGTVRVEVRDRFDQAGINQTRHSIYLKYNTDVRVVVPLRSGRASVATQVPVAENIIIGEVPSTFVSFSEGFFRPGINR